MLFDCLGIRIKFHIVMGRKVVPSLGTVVDRAALAFKTLASTAGSVSRDICLRLSLRYYCCRWTHVPPKCQVKVVGCAYSEVSLTSCPVISGRLAAVLIRNTAVSEAGALTLVLF
jgi:hypothetical protein